MGIEIDLDHHRKPGLDLDVNETEPGIHEVGIQAQTLAPGRLHEGSAFVEPKRESRTGFEYAEDTDQTLPDLIPLNHFPSRLFHRHTARQVLEGSAFAFSPSLGVAFDTVGLFKQKRLQIAKT